MLCARSKYSFRVPACEAASEVSALSRLASSESRFAVTVLTIAPRAGRHQGRRDKTRQATAQHRQRPALPDPAYVTPTHQHCEQLPK